MQGAPRPPNGDRENARAAADRTRRSHAHTVARTEQEAACARAPPTAPVVSQNSVRKAAPDK
eukprot:4600329-Pleurochrysis_carterae.AAC.2